MHLSSITTAIIVGLIIGVLGRVIAPGRQRLSMLTTILIGIAAAFLGTLIYTGTGHADWRGINWTELLIQVLIAALGVALFSRTRDHDHD